MLIPLNKIDLEYLDFSCLDDCKGDNLTKFQALIDMVCTKIDWTKVDLKTLVVPTSSTKTNPVDILNIIVTKLVECCIAAPANTFTFDITKIQLCGKDNYTIANYQDCLTVLNECFGVVTLEAIIQAIIKRLNTFAFEFQQMNLKLIDLTTKYNSLNASVLLLTNKINNCCP